MGHRSRAKAFLHPSQQSHTESLGDHVLKDGWFDSCRERMEKASLDLLWLVNRPELPRGVGADNQYA